MAKMNPEIKARWVAALRSGAYQQGRDALQRAGAFCCLGVLCDLHDPHSWQVTWNGMKYGGNDGMPPFFVNKWAGFPEGLGGISLVPQLVINGEQRSIDSHNDSGVPFPVIADAIEAQL